MNKYYDFEQIEGLLSIVLFGSKARGEEDDFSDVDIFLLVEDIPQDRIEEIIDILKSKLLFDNIRISLYQISTYKQLLLEGSMFIWHLKLEGRIIYKKSNINLYNNLVPFTKFQYNLSLYKKLYINAKASLKANGMNEFDLSQLFFICRNVCLLTCFKLSYPTFGRISVYDKLLEIIGVLPLSRENYILLSRWRLSYTRAIDLNLNFPTGVNMLKILAEIDNLFTLSREIIESGGQNVGKITKHEDILEKIEKRQNFSI
ncbi:hypothetical protein AM499_02000 [Bacillus sp. FJAT-22090]|uniref:nucleotidyltransferase domain-containing protein n=1 Tax=Bacillus sp. FJAT-22090 TaxID=1581038 RepID=UPI0006AE6D44|nr:nucleotidyltransferase domain-containing protein [Bacillus sp. FJAT-22090]ALC84718.1 hypothetical protein AM499_02000 [Bacillus sp. FJAT-22090]